MKQHYEEAIRRERLEALRYQFEDNYCAQRRDNKNLNQDYKKNLALRDTLDEGRAFGADSWPGKKGERVQVPV